MKLVRARPILTCLVGCAALGWASLPLYRLVVAAAEQMMACGAGTNWHPVSEMAAMGMIAASALLPLVFLIVIPSVLLPMAILTAVRTPRRRLAV